MPKAFYDGMIEAGQENVMNLVRAHGLEVKNMALLFGPVMFILIPCSERADTAGINMGIAGIPWWTTDIGGF